MRAWIFAAAAAGLAAAPALAQTPAGPAKLPQGVIRTALHDFRVETVAQVAAKPYGFDFLPDGRILITEIGGALRVVDKGRLLLDAVIGAPAGGFAGSTEYEKRGLLDVIVHPDFKTNGWIYLTTGRPVEEGGKTVTHVQIVRGRIKDNRWTDSQVILDFPVSKTNALRMAFDAQRRLYIGSGFEDHAFPGTSEENVASPPQSLASPSGKVLRLNDDGSVPADNPFAKTPGAYPYVWTWGNRAPLGLAFDAKGELWEAEDGPRGGDEINHLRAGRNYGWPVVTWGHRYDAKAVAANTLAKDMEPPVVALVPSPAVSAITFYEGKPFARWKGSLLMGSLKQRDLFRVVLDGDRAVSQEVILHDVDRIRDVAVGPDGLIYLLTDTGLFLRLVPARP